MSRLLVYIFKRLLLFVHEKLWDGAYQSRSNSCSGGQATRATVAAGLMSDPVVSMEVLFENLHNTWPSIMGGFSVMWDYGEEFLVMWNQQ